MSISECSRGLGSVFLFWVVIIYVVWEEASNLSVLRLFDLGSDYLCDLGRGLGSKASFVSPGISLKTINVWFRFEFIILFFLYWA
jgi:hypothetical protein